MINQKDKDLALYCLERARKAGADKARVTLSRSTDDIVSCYNGEIDKVSHCADSSVAIGIFADGRYGSFSSNKLSPEAIDNFIDDSVKIVRMLAPDECRDLPEASRCCKDAPEGNELGLCEVGLKELSPEERNAMALEACVFHETECSGDYSLISEEGELSDSSYDTVLADSQGTLCCHSERNYDYGVELTIEAGGNRYSAYHWDSSINHSRLMTAECGREALRKAVMQIGAEPVESGKYNMVVDSDVASKLVSPLLAALRASSIQQNNSFLQDSLGKRLFSEKLCLADMPRIPGESCSKYFDSEGVATADSSIIDAGTVRQYFVNSYMSRKMGLTPTIEDATRPVLLPTLKGCSASGLMQNCGDGIYVTGFNGGNSNPVSGDFSYGIEGFLFRQGKIVKPVSGMLVTGNFLKLWKELIDTADDARRCMSKLIPTLAFENVDFSG